MLIFKDGDIISLANTGDYDVIVHGCNCFSRQKSGLAPQMVKAFGTDTFEKEDSVYAGDINKLGTLDYNLLYLENGRWVRYPDEGGLWVTAKIYVVNAYTQYYYGKNHPDGKDKPINYIALSLCMEKINSIFAGKKILLPKIGSGLAGGDWDKILKIIKEKLTDCDTTIVNYKL